MQKLSQPVPEGGQEESTTKETREDVSESPTSILRKRTKEAVQKRGQLRKRVSFVEPHVAQEKREQGNYNQATGLHLLRGIRGIPALFRQIPRFYERGAGQIPHFLDKSRTFVKELRDL